MFGGAIDHAHFVRYSFPTVKCNFKNERKTCWTFIHNTLNTTWTFPIAFSKNLIHTELIHTPQVHKTVFYAFTLLINYSISGAKIYVNCTSKLYLIDGFMLMYSEDMKRYVCMSKHNRWMIYICAHVSKPFNWTLQGHILTRFKLFWLPKCFIEKKNSNTESSQRTSKSFILQLCDRIKMNILGIRLKGL